MLNGLKWGALYSPRNTNIGHRYVLFLYCMCSFMPLLNLHYCDNTAWWTALKYTCPVRKVKLATSLPFTDGWPRITDFGVKQCNGAYLDIGVYINSRLSVHKRIYRVQILAYRAVHTDDPLGGRVGKWGCLYARALFLFWHNMRWPDFAPALTAPIERSLTEPCVLCYRSWSESCTYTVCITFNQICAPRHSLCGLPKKIYFNSLKKDPLGGQSICSCFSGLTQCSGQCYLLWAGAVLIL